MPLVSWRAKRAADVALRNGLVQGDGEIVARWTLHVQVVTSISELS